MYRDKLEELAARWRGWDERPDEAPLDVLSWPHCARAIWEALSAVVRDLSGAIATPRSLWTFEGPITFFSVDGVTVPHLKFATLVRAYRLVHESDVSLRPGISRNALAAVVVAMHGIRAAPMLLPVHDDRSAESMMWMHGWQAHSLVELHPKVRLDGQQPASIVIGKAMEAPGSNVSEIVKRVAGRLDRDLGELPFAYAGAAGGRRNR
jgi:hypothetical protein